MYIQRLQYYPALGKARELRALLEERTKSLQSSGYSLSLRTQLMGGEEGNPFIALIRHDDLAAIDAFRLSMQADQAQRDFQAKGRELITRQAVTSLSEVLILSPANLPRVAAGSFVQQAVLSPTPGKGPELRTLLEERVNKFHSAGQRANLTVSVYGTDGQRFSLSTSHENLAALDDMRHRNQSDPAQQEWASRVQGLLRDPIRLRLSVVLIPIPS